MKKKMFGGANKSLFVKASDLRSRQTFAEELLWEYLRQKPLGFKFRRQHPYGNYILDFYCHAQKLVIEVDGSIHDVLEIKEKDARRQKHLETDGLRVLRFSNDEIKQNPTNVYARIETNLSLDQAEKGKR